MSVDGRRKSKRNSDSARPETQLFNPDENWGENTTAVTGATSDAGFSMDEDYNGMHTAMKPDTKSPSRAACRRAFSRLAWLLAASAVWLSPAAMLVLPKALSSLTAAVAGGGHTTYRGANRSRGGGGATPGGVAKGVHVAMVPRYAWTTDECSAACESQLVAIACKMFVLGIGCWALFLRKRSVQLPRVFVFRAASMLLILLVTFAFWLFYGVRVFEPKVQDYDTIVTFSSSFIDSLLFLHYFAVILIELRHLKSEFVVRVTRSPDGATRTYSCGALSVQRLAAFCLERYYRDFSVYNPYLETLTHSTPKPTEFKFYNVDEVNQGEENPQTDNNGNSEETQSRAIFAANARRRDAKHNDRFYEEQEYERRVKKRQARLLVAAEEAFTHIRRKIENHGPSIPMDAEEAAQAIFPSMARSMQKYLRVTRQQPNYTMASIMKRLADAVSKDESPRAFLQLYLQQAPLLWNEKACEEDIADDLGGDGGSQTWTLTSDHLVNQAVVHGTQFTVCQADVTLAVEVKALPSLNILERVTTGDHKFVLRLNSETSV